MFLRRNIQNPARFAGQWATLLVLATALFAWQVDAAAQDAFVNREYPIKAAFLYHFANYVTWPDTAFTADSQPFVIGVYQSNPFGTALDAIAQTKKVAGRSIVVRRIASLDELQSCHILFVPRSVPAADQQAVLSAMQNSFVFAVGEISGFAEQGGHAEFFVQGNKVRFAFSHEAAKRNDLKISPKLLALAAIKPAH